jgi:hypothetical protein
MLGLVVAIAAGAAASAWLWSAGRRRDEAAAGLVALGGMRWREFSHFVLDAMRHRGFEVDNGSAALDRGQQSDFVLRRPDGARWLMSCKHGAAYRIGPAAIEEFVSSLRFNDASGGVLVTTGQVESAAHAAADRARIEVIEGAALWNEIRDFLPGSLRESLRAQADAQARRRTGIAWLGALTVGIATAVLAGNLGDAPGPAARVAAQGAAAPAAAGSTTQVVESATDALPDATPDDLAARDEAQRAEVARVVGALPGVERASWPTRSTLLVNLAPGDGDRVPGICAVLEQYPTLRTSRLQLQPPDGSGDPPRFRQCTVY